MFDDSVSSSNYCKLNLPLLLADPLSLCLHSKGRTQTTVVIQLESTVPAICSQVQMESGPGQGRIKMLHSVLFSHKRYLPSYPESRFC
jgi:hypothetical protein